MHRVHVCLLSLLTVFVFVSSQASAQPNMASDKLRFADGLYNQGLYKLAVREYEEFVQSYPRHAQVSFVRLRLGDSYLQQKRYDDAIRVLQKLLAEDPRFEDRLEAGFRLGRSLVESGRYQEAVRVLSSSLGSSSPKEKKESVGQLVAYWLGEAYARSNQPEKALSTLDELLTHKVDAELVRHVHYTAAWSAYKAKKFDQAAPHFKSVLTSESSEETRAECQYMIGECLFEKEKFGNALGHYTEAAKLEGPYQDDAAFARGWCLFESGQFALSGDAFKLVVDRMPESDLVARARLRAGISYYQAKKDQDARAVLLAAANEKDPAVGPEAHYWLSMVFLRQNDAESAVQFLSRVRTSDEKLLTRVSVALGEALFRQGKHKDALRAFSRLTSQATSGGGVAATGGTLGGENGSLAYALHASALCHQALEDPQKALDTEEALLQLFPKSTYVPAALQVSGEALFALGKFEMAASRLGRLVKEFPDDTHVPAALYKRGWSLFELENYSEARRSFVTLTTRHPKSPFVSESKKLAGQCLARLGKSDDAIRELERVAEVQGEVGDHATLEVARLKRDQKDLSGSVRSYGKLAAGTKDPSLKARAFYEQGEVYYEAGSFSEAATSYGSSFDAAEDQQLKRAARYGRSWSLNRGGDFEAAIQSGRKLLSAPDLPEDLKASTHHLIGASFQKQGKWQPAIASFGALLRDHPDSALAYEAGFGLGVCLAGAGKNKEAKKQLDQLVRKNPEGPANDRVLYELAFACQADQDDAGMERAFSRFMKDYPKSPLAPEVRFRLGELHYGKGQYDKAAENYAGVLPYGGSPYLDKSLYKKGWAERQAKQNEKASASFSQLTTECKDSSLRGEAFFLNGNCLRDLKKPLEAEKSYRSLLTEYPKHELTERCHLALGLAQYEGEAYQDAVRTLSQHRQRYAESERLFEVDFFLGKSCQALKRSASAIQAFRRVTASYRGETAARAQYEIGECLRAQNNHEGALSEYLKVRYLYGHEEWVTASMFRCAETFEQLKQMDRAFETYTELVEKHPETKWARLGKTRLEKLEGSM